MFLEYFKNELDEETSQLLDGNLDLNELEQQNLFEVFTIIAKLLSSQEDSGIANLFDRKKEYSIFKNVPEILSEEHYDCIQVLLLINSCSTSYFNFKKSYEFKQLFLPAVILFNGNILTKSLSTLPKGNMLLR